ncbi:MULTISPECIES: ELM1/GtrOC1 family putative glycosyltransferase [unclassified Microbulbifer]|uniref:ELM1/GtrOC1 family putative glycosyltransferase n=1 Tax=unclassified Microbulbifer TaxID=2619833 RepID=UPI0027E5AC24|nr:MULTISPECIES: ELM1/GtrOC1 family putative glycosyltransferase [unclassified Microbulbifer]
MNLTIWTLRDGNRGHEKQVDGLLQGLASLQSIRSYGIDCRYSTAEKWHEWLDNRFVRGNHLPEPDLIVGAGHKTHLPLLSARNRHGGRAVVLMRPTLPASWFDYAIVPQHDRPPLLGNVIASRGVLAPGSVKISTEEKPCGLILLGGENRYFTWNSAHIVRQLNRICEARPDLHWLVADSRRTPADTRKMLAALGDRCQYVHWRDTGSDWLPRIIAAAREIWVSPDSASMLFEALNSHAAVGVLNLSPRGRCNKLLRGIRQLSECGEITPYPLWQLRGFPNQRRAPLNEHLRCAQLLLERMAGETNTGLATV